MDSLPDEILVIIFNELNGENVADRTSFCATEELKSIRLSCKRFAEIGIEYILREVQLFMDESSFAKVKWYSENPGYCRMIRSLVYNPRSLCEDLLLEECYDICIRLEKFRLSTDSLLSANRNIGPNLYTTKSFSQMLMDSLKLYTNVVNGDSENFRKILAQLPGMVQSFTGLSAVAAAFFRTLMSGKIILTIPRELDNFLQRSIDFRTVRTATSSSLVDDCNLLIQSITKAQRKLELISPTSYEAWLNLTLSSQHGEVFQQASQSFTALKHLTIGLPDHDSRYEAASFRSVLDKTPYLETLAVTCPKYKSPVSANILHTVLGDFHCPALKSLSLANVAVHETQLLAWIRAHDLASLELQKLILESGSWFRIFEGIRAHPPTAAFALRGAQCSMSGRLRYVCLDSDIAIEELVRGFVLSEYAWSDFLPDTFLIDVVPFE